jgi:hypothetical protein
VRPFQTQRDELLQQLGIGVLDVVEVEHHVVAHLEPQVDLLHLLARGRVGRFTRIQGAHFRAERGPVHLHEDEPEFARDVLHQRGLAVAGRGDQEQEAHLIGALGGSSGAELLCEIGADERQVHLVDQAIADERGEHPRQELRQAQTLALTARKLRPERTVAAETICPLLDERAYAAQHFGQLEVERL